MYEAPIVYSGVLTDACQGLSNRMDSKKIAVPWPQKIIYGLLIFCVGGIGPLTFFDAFTPDHAHPYHFSLLERQRNAHPHQHNHKHLPDSAGLSTQQTDRSLPKRLPASPYFVAAQQGIVSGVASFFQSGLSCGYLLTIIQRGIISNNTLLSYISLSPVTGYSAWLPPPENPPSIFFS